MSSEDGLPNRPPPDGKFSIDEARQIITWIWEHAGPVLEEAERMPHERSPGAEIGRSVVTVGDLARRGGPTPNMRGLAVETLRCQVLADSLAMVDIVIVLDQRGGW